MFNQYILKNKNQFERISIIASKNNWCWKLHCTTCGCRDIRGAFYCIGLGLYIPNNLKRISQIKNDFTLNQKFPNEILNNFLESVIDADLFEINNKCKFPDWLGYIGLIFYLFDNWDEYDEIERQMGKISLRDVAKSFCPQFIKMVSKKSNAFTILNDIINSNYLIKLQVSDLEKIELGLLKNYDFKKNY